MKSLLGSAAAAAMVMTAVAAQAQVLPPMRGGDGGMTTVVRVSDFGGPYAAMPRVYEAAPRVYAAPRLVESGYDRPGYGYAPAVLAPREVYEILRDAGYSPLGAPQQRGLVYTVSAIDRDGEDGRMVIDARSGRILRFMPASRMGDRMSEEIVTRYGPEAALPELPEYRRPPYAAGPVAPGQKFASRTPGVPLPKRPPVRAVATPEKPVAATASKPVAVAPAETPPAAAPVQQSAVTQPQAAEPKAPETTGAAAVAKPDAAPTVAPPTTEAKPAEVAKPADTPPPVQGLE